MDSGVVGIKANPHSTSSRPPPGAAGLGISLLRALSSPPAAGARGGVWAGPGCPPPHPPGGEAEARVDTGAAAAAFALAGAGAPEGRGRKPWRGERLEDARGTSQTLETREAPGLRRAGARGTRGHVGISLHLRAARPWLGSWPGFGAAILGGSRGLATLLALCFWDCSSNGLLPSIWM